MFRNNPLLAENLEFLQTKKQHTRLALWTTATLKTLAQRQIHMDQIFGSCP